MEIIIKFKVELPDDPEIPLMRNNGEKSWNIPKGIFTPIFIHTSQDMGIF
jgi:hypothetical protein